MLAQADAAIGRAGRRRRDSLSRLWRGARATTRKCLPSLKALEVTIDERVAGRPLDEHGERAAAARSTVWPWVVGAIDRTHEAEIFFSLAPTTGVSLPAVDNFQLLFRSA